VGILVTFVPPKVTARRGMSDMPPRGTAVTHNRTRQKSRRDLMIAAALLKFEAASKR